MNKIRSNSDVQTVPGEILLGFGQSFRNVSDVPALMNFCFLGYDPVQQRAQAAGGRRAMLASQEDSVAARCRATA